MVPSRQPTGHIRYILSKRTLQAMQLPSWKEQFLSEFCFVVVSRLIGAAVVIDARGWLKYFA
jgi:hypothetical protein